MGLASLAPYPDPESIGPDLKQGSQLEPPTSCNGSFPPSNPTPLGDLQPQVAGTEPLTGGTGPTAFRLLDKTWGDLQGTLNTPGSQRPEQLVWL